MSMLDTTRVSTDTKKEGGGISALPGVADLAPSNEADFKEMQDLNRKALTERLIASLRKGDIAAFNELRPETGFDLSGVDLSGLSLRGINLSRCILVGANLKGCDLEGADFTSSNLTRIDLSHTILKDSKFSFATMPHAIMNGVVRAENADFEAAKIVRADLTRGRFSGARFNHAMMHYSALSGSDFSYAEFTEAILFGTLLHESSFYKANLRQAEFFNAVGHDVNFEEANLSDASMLRLYFTSTHQKDADGKEIKTNFKGSWVKGLQHDGFGVQENLLGEAITDRFPPEGTFPQREKPEEKALLIDGIPGSNRQLYDAALLDLEKLIGLDEIKEIIRRQVSVMKFQHAREMRGHEKADMNLHFVFTGSPGTGKTTVARLLSKMLHAMAHLKKGHLVECRKDHLIAEYQGQTATKTAKKIEEALGGTLFIDEAYSLTQNAQDEYSKDAIATLVQMMENHRNELSVIVAGYKKEMKTFITANSGLPSRFTIFIDFPDYSNSELVEIMKVMLDGKGFKYDGKFLAAASIMFAILKAKNRENFGNAREVRTAVQETITAMAARVEGKYDEPGALVDVKAEDLPFESIVGVPFREVKLEEFCWVKDGTSVTFDQISSQEKFPELSEESLKGLEAVANFGKLEEIEKLDQELDQLEERTDQSRKELEGVAIHEKTEEQRVSTGTEG